MSIYPTRSGWLRRLLRLADSSTWAVSSKGLTADEQLVWTWSQVKSVELRKSLISCAISITTHQGEERLIVIGAARSSATRFQGAAWRTLKVLRDAEHITNAAQHWHSLVQRKSYLNHYALQEWLSAHAGLSKVLSFNTDDLELPEQVAKAVEKCRLVQTRGTEITATHNESFVERELSEHAKWFDELESNPLTPRQREAVVRNEDRNLVVAGAGTGKTSVVVARVSYLIKTKEATPDQILVLAFNRKAAAELQERIAKRIGVKIEIRTFHALALHLIGKATGRKPTVSKLANDKALFIQQVDKWVDEAMEDPATRSRVLPFLAYYLQPEPSENENRTLDEHYRYLRANDIRTLQGELVKSRPEQVIANWLYVNGIPYEYEAVYSEAETADADHSAYQPDFFLPEHNVYIEHFGIDRKGETAPEIDSEEYCEAMAWKRQLHGDNETVLVETFQYEHTEGNLLELLETRLREVGVQPNPPPWPEVKAKLGESGSIKRACKLLMTFLGLCREQGLELAELERRAIENRNPSRAQAFLAMFKGVHASYLKAIEGEKAIDFGHMIAEAAKCVRSRQYRSPYTHVVVDEFQDISVGRARLIKALIEQVPDCRLHAVGDDWQSIYRFAGSDVSIMVEFEKEFGATIRTDLDMAFRFPNRLLDVSSRFIMRNPKQLTKSLSSAKSMDEPPITVVSRSPGEDLHGQVCSVLTTIEAEAKPGSSVLILTRYKMSQKDLPRTWNKLKLDTRTIHSAKGLEADYVLVLDLNSDKYGFPSEIEDDPLLELVLSSIDPFTHSEERRLFYVAITRSRSKIFLLVDPARPSSFITELNEMTSEHELAWVGEPYTPVRCTLCNGPIVRRKGKHGDFWSCGNYPQCKGKGRTCPNCSSLLDTRKRNLRCSSDKCGFASVLCSRRKCDGYMVERKGRYGKFYGCSKYPNCKQKAKHLG